MADHSVDSSARTRDERFNIRVRQDEKALIERAARIEGLTTSQFLVRAALRSAEQVLGDRRDFVLPAADWDAFVEALDRPARVIPELRAAALKPRPFVEP